MLRAGDWARAWFRGSQPLFTWDDPGPQVLKSLSGLPGRVAKLLPGRRR